MSDFFQDFANPLRRKHMHFYPELRHPDSPAVSQAWHFDKWLNKIPDHMLSPMVIHGGRHFYVGELARCHDGKYFIPEKWIGRQRSADDESIEMCAAGHYAIPSKACHLPNSQSFYMLNIAN